MIIYFHTPLELNWSDRKVIVNFVIHNYINIHKFQVCCFCVPLLGFPQCTVYILYRMTGTCYVYDNMQPFGLELHRNRNCIL